MLYGVAEDSRNDFRRPEGIVKLTKRVHQLRDPWFFRVMQFQHLLIELVKALESQPRPRVHRPRTRFALIETPFWLSYVRVHNVWHEILFVVLCHSRQSDLGGNPLPIVAAEHQSPVAN